MTDRECQQSERQFASPQFGSHSQVYDDLRKCSNFCAIVIIYFFQRSKHVENLQNATGASLGACLTPFLEPIREQEAKQLIVSHVARCNYCDSYINPYATFDEFGWICPLCHSQNAYSDGCNSRYLGGEEHRSYLPELRSNVVDVCLDGMSSHQDIQTRPNPLVWPVIDVTCDSDSLGSITQALLVAIETLLPDKLFALSLVDDEYLYIMDWKSGKFHRLSNRDEQKRLQNINCCHLVQPVPVVREAAMNILGQLESKPRASCHEDLTEDLIGYSLRCIFTIVSKVRGSELTTIFSGRPLGSRLLLFLGKNLLRGIDDGSDTRRMTQVDYGFYIDPLNADLLMREPFDKSHAWHEETSHKIFTGAGATAVVLGLAVHSYIVGPTLDGYRSISILSHMSGGSIGHYSCYGTTLTEDLFKAVNKDDFFDCTIKVRTSTELSITKSFGGQLNNYNNKYGPNLLQAPFASQQDGFGVILGHVHGYGMTERSPLCIQAAIAFSVLKPQKYGLQAQRYLRIITEEFPLARTITEAAISEDTDVQLYLQFKSCLSLLSSQNENEAESFLQENIERRMHAQNSYMQDIEYLELDKKSKHQIQDSLSALVCSLENLLGIIRMSKDSAKERLNLLYSLHTSNNSCYDVAVAVYPKVTYWSEDGNTWLHTLTWDKREQYDAPVLLVDMYDLLILYRCSGDADIRSKSKLLEYVGSLRKSRTPTPLFSVHTSESDLLTSVQGRIFS